MIKIFDGHADIWNDVVNKRLAGEKHVIGTHHLHKFKTGNITAGIFVVWVDTPLDQPVKRFQDTLAMMQEELDENSNQLSVVRAFEDIALAEQMGKFPIILGIEGFDGITGGLEELHSLYNMGFRHASLTWNTENQFATGVKGNPDRGLTPLGRTAVMFMNKMRMLLDLSHANDKTFWEILSLSSMPVIASHSNTRAICNHPRNLSDTQIREVANTGGLIGLNAYCELIHPQPKKQTLETYLDHVERVCHVAGIDHVALGFDFVDYLGDSAMASFAGEPSVTKGLNSALEAQCVPLGLKARGFSNEEIQKICSNNYLRVIQTVLG